VTACSGSGSYGSRAEGNSRCRLAVPVAEGASQFMSVLQRAELVESTRIGQWTYYRRHDARISQLPDLFSSAL
jgi:hypothetical protein